jgi:hypothetical protein
MSFRQHNKTAESLWRKNNRTKLISAGIPNHLVDDESLWTYVLLHGYDPFGSGWDCSSLTRKQAQELLNLLRPQYPNIGGLDLINLLEKRLVQE